MRDNKLLDYLDDYMYFVRHEDNEGLQALKDQNREKYVSREEIGDAFVFFIDEMMDQMEVASSLTEMRLQAIVDSLPEETQDKIKQSFKSVQDDVFEEDKTQE